MRCVLAPPTARPPVPDRSQLDAVRHLGHRFPNARVREVPIVRAAELDLRADPAGSTRIWLALEALQVTGCYQVRGALVALAGLASRRGLRDFVAPSVGNHGIAVAYAACVLGMSATVVVPRTTPRTKKDKIERYGATLIVADSDHYEAAERIARALAEAQGALFVPPTDDMDLVLGNGGSLGLEIVRGLGGVPENVLVPFGAGALATGLAWAFASEAATDGGCAQSVWGVQSDVTCAMATWLERNGSGRPADESQSSSAIVAAGPTLAEEIAPGSTPDAFARARTAVAGVVVVSEEMIGEAMAHAYRDMGLVLEGTAALALAPVLFGLPEPLRGGDLVVVLTGRNVDPELLLRHA
jgi:threonine dehydratase